MDKPTDDEFRQLQIDHMFWSIYLLRRMVNDRQDSLAADLERRLLKAIAAELEHMLPKADESAKGQEQ